MGGLTQLNRTATDQGCRTKFMGDSKDIPMICSWYSHDIYTTSSPPQLKPLNPQKTSGAPFPSISALEDTIEGHAEAVV